MTTRKLSKPRTDGQSEVGDAPPKATLFCPDCGHQSPVDGDWTVVETDSRTQLQCPDCETAIQVESRADGRGDSSVSPAALLKRNVRTWARFRRRLFASGD